MSNFQNWTLICTLKMHLRNCISDLAFVYNIQKYWGKSNLICFETFGTFCTFEPVGKVLLVFFSSVLVWNFYNSISMSLSSFWLNKFTIQTFEGFLNSVDHQIESMMFIVHNVYRYIGLIQLYNKCMYVLLKKETTF